MFSFRLVAVKLKNCGSLAELLRVRCCEVKTQRTSCRIAALSILSNLDSEQVRRCFFVFDGGGIEEGVPETDYIRLHYADIPATRVIGIPFQDGNHVAELKTNGDPNKLVINSAQFYEVEGTQRFTPKVSWIR